MYLFTFSVVWPWILGSLATVLLISGIDDLIPSLICFWFTHIRRLHRLYTPSKEPDKERRIAIFVPCWKESGVIADMIRHNVAAVRYRNYAFFLGVYPNDTATLDIARQLAATFRNVHVAACPHPGPTSKPDCLNWIYQRMLRYEDEHRDYFDTIVLHDAEDLIHPEALATISRERGRNAMVQVPVLPLATPPTDLTHGCYCDDFAEYQSVDMKARQFSRSFIPSSGVGTGFARHIFEELAERRNNLIFDPASLTEDYEAGVYIFNAGYRQRFVPLARHGVGGSGGAEGCDGYVATREYFPRRVRSAIRQRTRWVTGIALQSWARDGWRGSWSCKYWFWRDRKGLLANPLGLLTNMLFLAGLADWADAAIHHRAWAFAVSNPALLRLCLLTSALQCVRLAMRMFHTGRIFGVGMALGVPVRSFHGNFINCFASLGALWQYANARIHARPLIWQKTDHAYPVRDSLLPHNRDLAEVLVSEGYISGEEIAGIQAELRSEAYLGELLMQRGYVSQDKLCRAVSLRAGVPFTHVKIANVRRRVTRTLPRDVGTRFGIVPFHVEEGKLHVAGAEVPRANLHQELAGWTTLPIEFHLVTQQDYENLQDLL